LYEKLKKDDLPKYQEQFHEYLQDTMNNDIVDFNQFIQNEEQEIRTAISDLNASLRKIRYEHNPDTYLQLEFSKNNDVRINEFKEHLKNAIPNAFDLSSFDSEKEEELFNKIKLFLDTVKANDANRKYILDIRNWYTFAASEKYKETGIQKQFYPDSGSLSGGEKAKLTYTILASAIAYQFGLTQEESARSFRFAIIDEAFSKSDSANSDYAMRLFKQLDLQIMVITPQDKINIVEDYISTVHITEKIGTKDSRLLPLTIERYKEQQKEVLQGKKI
ncbi:MAG TPA: SbcC/MukB-like Walker B domain-containing protein, partial [Treponemataceae bacterium]|nr:SbcC/MukB-like Walker B domain-containing protein [Treponemataceae bacterium]